MFMWKPLSQITRNPALVQSRNITIYLCISIIIIYTLRLETTTPSSLLTLLNFHNIIRQCSAIRKLNRVYYIHYRARFPFSSEEKYGVDWRVKLNLRVFRQWWQWVEDCSRQKQLESSRLTVEGVILQSHFVLYNNFVMFWHLVTQTHCGLLYGFKTQTNEKWCTAIS